MNHPTAEEYRYFAEFSKAVEENNEDIINTLLQKDGYLQKCFYYPKNVLSFLHFVAEKGTVKTAKQICELGGNINITEKIKNTPPPIFNAIKNSVEMLTFFVKNGADVNYVVPYLNLDEGTTPLHHAARHSAEAVKILLQSGAKIFDELPERTTVLQEAIYCGSEETVQIIINKFLSHTQTKFKQAETTEETIKILLKNKALLNIRQYDYSILILFAAKFGNEDTFKLVLQDCRNNSDRMKDNFKEVNYRGRYGRTALHYAVREELPEVVRFLLKNGADVNCKTIQQYTPLHYAVRVRNEEICKILLSFGASVDSSSSKIGSPLHQLCEKDSDLQAGYFYLEDNINKLRQQNINIKIMKLLLESGANPNISTRKGISLLHDFCSCGNVEAVEILFQFGVNLYAQDEKGNSALHFAARNDSLEIVDFLLKKGLDVDIRNFENNTPLLFRLMNSSHLSNLEMIVYLVDRGADVNARNNSNQTPSNIACKYKSTSYIEGLLELGCNVKLEDTLGLRVRFHDYEKTLISILALNKSELDEYKNCKSEHLEQLLSKAYKYFDKSKLEVKKMKSMRIVQETHFSFYNFLTGSCYDAVRFLKNEAIKNIFKSREYYTSFPCYSYLIEKRFQRVLELTDAVNEIENFLLSSFPTIVISKILNFMNSSDFRNFYRVLLEQESVTNSKFGSVVTGDLETGVQSTEEPSTSKFVETTLKFQATYWSKIIEIRETGVMVSIYPNMNHAFLSNSQLHTKNDNDFQLLNLKIGDMILVRYLGRYPGTKEENNCLANMGVPTAEELGYLAEFSKAVEENNEDIINTLLQKDGYLQKCFYYHKTVLSFLHIVAEKGTVKTAKQICKLGGNINITEEMMKEPPIFNAIKNSAEMLKFFVENGADVNHVARQLNRVTGTTPLHHAARHSAEAVKIILQSGAKVPKKLRKTKTVLQEAICCGSEETVRIIINKILSETETDIKQAETTEETIKILLNNKGLLYISQHDYPILMLLAAKLGNEDTFKLVLQDSLWTIYNFEQVNYKGLYGRTALHYAVREELPEVVRFLLKHGADANCKTKKQYTPLHYAVRVRNEEICKILLSSGATVDSSSSDIGSPLHQLCDRDSFPQGGYCYLENNISKLQQQNISIKIMKLLLESGANPNMSVRKKIPLLHDFCSYGNLEAVEILFQFGVNLYAQDVKGNSALHFAARNDSLEIVDFLLKKGLNVDIRNFENNTPLLFRLINSSHLSNLDMIVYLVDRGADVNARNNSNQTPLNLACRYISLKSTDYIEGLLELGSNVKLEDTLYRRFLSNCEDFFQYEKTLISFLALNKSELDEDLNCKSELLGQLLSKAHEYFDKSRHEVNKMKSMRIVQETHISFYNFLTCSYYDAVRFLKNEAIKNVFKSREYYTSFPCYSYLMEKRFQRVLELMDAVNEMENVLSNYLSSFPTAVISKILNFMNSSDFRNFYRNLLELEPSTSKFEETSLKFQATYWSKVIEIRETGVMVSLYPNMNHAFLSNLLFDTERDENFHLLNLKVGDMIPVKYLGRYPVSKEIRISL